MDKEISEWAGSGVVVGPKLRASSSAPGLVLINIFINGQEAECALSKFADNTKL